MSKSYQQVLEREKKNFFLILFLVKNFSTKIREIIDFCIKARPQLFNKQRPVFDGRKFLYTKELCFTGEKVNLNKYQKKFFIKLTLELD